MTQLARSIRPAGDVVARLFPRDGFYAQPYWPEGMPASAKVRAFWLEATLRARLAAKGLWRGAVKASGVIGVGRLYVSVLRADGRVEHLGLICTKVITDAGVAFMVDDWDVNTASATNDITTLKYHGCGTGTGSESAGDTALGTESTTALNPDSTRPTGTQSQPSANILRSVGTVTFDATAAITEHGLFSQAATGGGTLWDRSVFSAINVASGDSIQFTYSCTLSSGG